MNKDKLKELKEKYSELGEYSAKNDDEIALYRYIERLIGELDDLEVKQQQELPVVPQFVAEWIEKCKEKGRTLSQAYSALNDENLNIIKWLYHEGDRNEKINLFARAWLDGYTVEEKKYYVLNNDNGLMLVRMMDGKTITEPQTFFKFEDMCEVEKKSHCLTEKEIKDYDPRYWAFRKPVEELEE